MPGDGTKRLSLHDGREIWEDTVTHIAPFMRAIAVSYERSDDEKLRGCGDTSICLLLNIYFRM